MCVCVCVCVCVCDNIPGRPTPTILASLNQNTHGQ